MIHGDCKNHVDFKAVSGALMSEINQSQLYNVHPSRSLFATTCKTLLRHLSSNFSRFQINVAFSDHFHYSKDIEKSG